MAVGRSGSSTPSAGGPPPPPPAGVPPPPPPPPAPTPEIVVNRTFNCLGVMIF
jgi:hypothetical protein